jgi:DNA polymerase
MNAERGCVGCDLGRRRKNFVFGSGNAQALIMVIGEAPGEDEDTQGRPFVGAAGQLLTKMLAAIHLDRDTDVFITNVLKCRPPQNRDPEPGEIETCLPLLRRQIEIIQPKAILLLGRIAAHALLDTDDSIRNLRRRRHDIGNIPAVVTYHPSALLRSASNKRPAWEDLQMFETMLKELGIHGSTTD